MSLLVKMNENMVIMSDLFRELYDKWCYVVSVDYGDYMVEFVNKVVKMVENDLVDFVLLVVKNLLGFEESGNIEGELFS